MCRRLSPPTWPPLLLPGLLHPAAIYLSALIASFHPHLRGRNMRDLAPLAGGGVPFHPVFCAAEESLSLFFSKGPGCYWENGETHRRPSYSLDTVLPTHPSCHGYVRARLLWCSFGVGGRMHRTSRPWLASADFPNLPSFLVSFRRSYRSLRRTTRLLRLPSRTLPPASSSPARGAILPVLQPTSRPRAASEPVAIRVFRRLSILLRHDVISQLSRCRPLPRLSNVLMLVL
jgi:hypothetical protein